MPDTAVVVVVSIFSDHLWPPRRNTNQLSNRLAQPAAPGSGGQLRIADTQDTPLTSLSTHKMFSTAF